MDFKNQIRHKAADIGNTLLKTFPEVLHHSHTGLNQVTVPATPRLPLKRSKAQGTTTKPRCSPVQPMMGADNGRG